MIDSLNKVIDYIYTLPIKDEQYVLREWAKQIIAECAKIANMYDRGESYVEIFENHIKIQ